MVFSKIESEYAETRLPEAFRWAVYKSKEAELLVYQVLTRCLFECEDVGIYLDKSDIVCKFLRSWKSKGYLSENALRYEETEDSALLSCAFDIYEIRDDLEFVNDCFGTINMAAIESSLDSSNIDIPEKRVEKLGAAVQKVKRPREVCIDNKKDN